MGLSILRHFGLGRITRGGIARKMSWAGETSQLMLGGKEGAPRPAEVKMDGASMVGGSLESSRHGAGWRGATESCHGGESTEQFSHVGSHSMGGLGFRALPSEHENEIDGG